MSDLYFNGIINVVPFLNDFFYFSISQLFPSFGRNDKQNKGYITLNIDQLTQIAAYLY